MIDVSVESEGRLIKVFNSDNGSVLIIDECEVDDACTVRDKLIADLDDLDLCKFCDKVGD